MIMSVYAPDFDKDLERFETFMNEATRILQEGRLSRSQGILDRRWPEY